MANMLRYARFYSKLAAVTKGRDGIGEGRHYTTRLLLDMRGHQFTPSVWMGRKFLEKTGFC